MKGRVLILGTAVILLSIIALGANAQDKYLPKEHEELCGTWTNGQNGGDIFHPQKAVIIYDGYKLYSKISDSVPLEEGTFGIDSKWTDSDGNVWYKTFGTITGKVYKGYRWQEIDKLSKSGTVWERALNPIGVGDFSPGNYPTKIDLNEPFYRILYRPKE